MKKIYVLDTNVLLHSPDAIEGFEDNYVCVTGTTLEELDSKKMVDGDVGYNARLAARRMEELRLKGNLIEGVKLVNGGTFFVEPDEVNQENLPVGFSINKPDNRIISSCIGLARKRKEKVILVSNDTMLRVCASTCGVEVQDYRNDRVEDDDYIGHRTVHTTRDIVDRIYAEKKIEATILNEPFRFKENEYVCLDDGGSSALGRYNNGEIKLLKEPRAFGIRPLNKMQRYALDALTAPASEIPLVILKGPAGTAKTFLSMAAALEGTYTFDYKRNRGGADYRKMYIGRANVTSDDDFGYLPGELEEKARPLLGCFYSNLEQLLSKDSKEDDRQIQMQIEDMMAEGVLEVLPIAYIRGMTLTGCFTIVDEAQNVNRTLMRDICTRIGKDSKLVILGDLNQIDSFRLDKTTSGLAYLWHNMQDLSRVALLSFSEKDAVRSDIATDALNRLL